MGKWDCLLLDPPWKFANRRLIRKDGGKARFGIGASGRYNTMSTDLLASLPIAEVMADTSVVFCWGSSAMAEDALRCIEAWGFRVSTVGFQWVKLNTGRARWSPVQLSKVIFERGLIGFLDWARFFGIGHWTACLTGDTLLWIMDSKGHVEHITLAELFYSRADPTAYQIYTPAGWKQIRGVCRKGSQETIKIVSQGVTIQATPEHRFVFKTFRRHRVKGSPTELRRTEYVTRCDTVTEIKRLYSRSAQAARGSTNLLFSLLPVVSVTPIVECQGFELSEDMAWALGLFGAEGSYGNRRAKDQQIRYSLGPSDECHIEHLKEWIDSLGLFSERYTSRRVTARVFRKGTARAVYFSCAPLVSLFQMFFKGEGAHGKRLNLDLLFQTTVAFRRAFIQGFWDGDGAHDKSTARKRIGLCNKGLVDDLSILWESIGTPTSTCGPVLPGRATLGGPTYRVETVKRGRVMPCGDAGGKALCIKSIENGGKAEVYDLTIEGGLFIANGLVSHNSNSEPCWIGIRGSPALERVDKSISSVVFAPVSAHSAKPPEVGRRIVKMFGPDRRYLELFARMDSPGSGMPGWTATGFDYDGLDVFDALRGLASEEVPSDLYTYSSIMSRGFAAPEQERRAPAPVGVLF